MWDVSSEMLATIRDDGYLQQANPRWQADLGWAPEELLERPLADLIHPDDRERCDQEVAKLKLGVADRVSCECRCRCQDGSYRWLAWNSVLSEENDLTYVSAHDITDRKLQEASLKRRTAQQETIAYLGELALRGTSLTQLFEVTAARMALTLDSGMVAILEKESDTGFFVVRASEGISDVKVGDRRPDCPSGTTHTSYTFALGASALGRETVPVLVEDYDLEPRFEGTVLTPQRMRSGLCVLIQGRKHPFGTISSISPLPGAFAAGDSAFFAAAAVLLADAVERSQSDEEMHKLALHDPLTGLANQKLFRDRLTHGLARAHRSGEQLAVMSLDLDAFKAVNDTFGHAVGDLFLIEVAQRIIGTIREGDTVARFGGDEFMLIYEGVADAAEAEIMSNRLFDALKTPFSIEGAECAISCSLGIALSDSENRDVDGLLHDADIALYLCKDRGGSTWTLATEAMRDVVTDRAKIKQALALAIDKAEIYLDYQPIVALKSGELCGVEALARWTHAERGSISPAVFVPIAEESDSIVRLGGWVLREACAQAVRWRNEFGTEAPLPIHVNVSVRQVTDLDLVEAVRAALDESGAEPSDIALEITETVMIESLGGTKKVLADLRLMGMKVVLDDFGTGYSSLSYLERFPVDTLKIDRSFISSLNGMTDPVPVVTAILGMAKAMKMTSVAEGVETADQAALLKELGCHFAQGYFFARPGSSDLISSLVRDGSYLRERAAEAAGISSLGLTGS